MSKIKDILIIKIKPIYLLLGILVVILFIFFFADFEKFYPWEPSSMTISQPKPQQITEEEEKPFVFVGNWPKNYTFILPNKMIQLPSGDFYVQDRNSAMIVKFTSNGDFIERYELGSKNYGSIGRDLLEDFAIDSDSNIYVVFSNYSLGQWPEVRKYDSQGRLIKSWRKFEAKELVGGMASLSATSVAIDSKNDVYATDTKLQCILKFDCEGNLINRWGHEGKGSAEFNFYSGWFNNRMAVDSLDNIYVCDKGNNRIQKFDSEGNFLLQFGESGSGNRQFNNPADITIGPDGNVYVVDEYNHRIQIFSPDGKWLGKWGVRSPISIMFDKDGKAYIISSATKGGYTIQIFKPSRAK
jgi:tripartite motif-containing protein 71